MLVENKCVSSLTQQKSAGKGSASKGGKPAKVGHPYAFGNTEEFYRVLVLGCDQRGRQRDGPMTHCDGKGWVRAQPGQYADALSKGLA